MGPSPTLRSRPNFLKLAMKDRSCKIHLDRNGFGCSILIDDWIFSDKIKRSKAISIRFMFLRITCSWRTSRWWVQIIWSWPLSSDLSFIFLLPFSRFLFLFIFQSSRSLFPCSTAMHCPRSFTAVVEHLSSPPLLLFSSSHNPPHPSTTSPTHPPPATLFFFFPFLFYLHFFQFRLWLTTISKCCPFFLALFGLFIFLLFFNSPFLLTQHDGMD